MRGYHELGVNEHSCICTCLSLERLKEPAQGTHYLVNITVSVFTILILIPGIILNALVLMAYRKNRQLQIPSNMLLMALAVTDLFICVVVQPLLVVKKIVEMYTTFQCFLWVAFRVIPQCCFAASLMTTALISVERFVTLAYPFRYQTIITQKRLKIVLALSFTIICLYQLPQMLTSVKGISVAFYSVFMTSFLLIICVAWLWIHRLTARHKRQIKALNTPSTLEATVKNTKTCYLVVGSSMICFFPSFAMLLFLFIISHERSLLYLSRTVIYPFCTAFLNINSLLNPLILLYGKRNFREAVKQLIF